MGKSIKVNFVFNLINSVSSVLFPLLTFPYAARVMEADGIGKINFLSSIMSYVSLFTSLGIPLYAVRAISKVRDNLYERNKTTAEILFLHLMLVTIGYLLVALTIIFVPQVHEDMFLFLILSLSILFGALGCEWFYQGTEDFKYITVRALIIRTLSVVFLFLLVRSKSDIYWYAVYNVVGTVGNNLFNFNRLQKKLKERRIPIGDIHPLKHLLPALHVFALNLIISIYIHLNIVMLGFMSSEESVGFFTGTTRVTGIALGFVNALGTVMLPRMSNLLANGKTSEFNALAQKAFSFVFAISLPLSVGVCCCAKYVMPLLGGHSYVDAIPTLQIISPIIFIIALSGVMGIQLLYPQGQENKVIISTGIGAIVNVIINIILIPTMHHNGAAIGTLLAEIAVTTSMAFIGVKYLPFRWNTRSHANYIIGSAIMMAVILPLTRTDLPMYIIFPLIILVGVATYTIILGLTKDPFILEIRVIIKNKLHL